jgi:hypothetical protein
MAAHKGPASSRPRCTRSGSSVAAIPVYQSLPECVAVAVLGCSSVIDSIGSAATVEARAAM